MYERIFAPSDLTQETRAAAATVCAASSRRVEFPQGDAQEGSDYPGEALMSRVMTWCASACGREDASFRRLNAVGKSRITVILYVT